MARERGYSYRRLVFVFVLLILFGFLRNKDFCELHEISQVIAKGRLHPPETPAAAIYLTVLFSLAPASF